jgi:hypothetical protein
MDVRDPGIGARVARLLPLLSVMLGVLACRARPTAIPARLPTLTPGIRHRDANALMLSARDLGPAYEAQEISRLERGRGWGGEATRLSGYRTVYTADRGTFSEVISQVECYLSGSDAQVAYQAYKDQLTVQLTREAEGSSVDKGEARGLGEWGWMFRLRGEGVETVHYLFVRENVVAEIVVSGLPSPGFQDEAARQAQIVDRRIQEP